MSSSATALDHILAAQAELDAAIGLLPPDPPPPSSAWRWPLAGAGLDPHSDALSSAFQAYAVAANGGPYFTSAVAHVAAPHGTPTYTIPLRSQTDLKTLTIPAPHGTQPGRTADQSLYLLDADGVEYDLAKVVYDPATGLITQASYGTAFPAGIAYAPGPGSGCAACFPLAAGPITPADLKAFAADPTKGLHPLVFSCPNVGPAPNRFPARPSSLGYPANTGIPLGTRVGFAPTAPLGSNATLLERYIFTCGVVWGLYCRDINPAPYGTLSIIGTDELNQGDNTALWAAAGVTLTGKGITGAPYLCKLTAQIPWSRLEVFQPPASS